MLEGADRFATDRIPITSIVVTTGQQDSGVFTLDLQGERYGPFEGAGVVSRWSLEFPTAMKQFDPNTISDIVMHVRYTSLEGGGFWKKNLGKAADAVLAELKKQAASVKDARTVALFDLKNDYSDQ